MAKKKRTGSAARPRTARPRRAVRAAGTRAGDEGGGGGGARTAARRAAPELPPAVGAVTVVPATPERWADVERLFGERGACGGCWCMSWRLPRREFEAGKGAGNRRRLKRLVEDASGPPPGVLAYQGGAPVGWCAVAPRSRFVALANSRVLKPLDEQPVWAVTCFFVAKALRGRGISVRLLQAACRLAQAHGATVVEGYPVEPKQARLPDPFVWTGLPGAFLKAGFREAHRWSPARPIMRWTAPAAS